MTQPTSQKEPGKKVDLHNGVAEFVSMASVAPGHGTNHFSRISSRISNNLTQCTSRAKDHLAPHVQPDKKYRGGNGVVKKDGRGGRAGKRYGKNKNKFSSMQQSLYGGHSRCSQQGTDHDTMTDSRFGGPKSIGSRIPRPVDYGPPDEA
ncbi:hypothetical protein CLAFUW4_13067 [Fulvia fulva]|uniref:Uncharacterized protein n=1 Tax=Passalora fulva TaxID=5499 RepID=A0A9Q8UVJ7_PASFU|nr:uncharacterized protein CLAFUR5_12925 [Fulvia fulva]KAK4611825.1 hypothetical protein CLAFUR4_13071 [Fulvia fulva]KAK4612492.1 hypothetical protein CLAFUR0_13075 [Fulvia fulva]UJO24069.1 hypothetical protein CLAFUR5_12925 [Fulvia fulva]WPV21010.1 hypothetical protein CLAFUW4_13067 [Fulvia fulva]WPV36001.1 hypothetical protein CLAFUW7_13074 [Fulvia fulva]